MRRDELIADLFAGGGGASLGIQMALGRGPDVAINHDPAAVAMHAANHPGTAHHCKSVFDVSPLEAAAGRPVGLLHASPDCTHFSRAKGGRPVSPRVLDLAWVVVDWASWVRPRVITLENVSEFVTWGPVCPEKLQPIREQAGETFREFIGQLQRLGYAVEWRTLNAADFGAPTSRRRLFLVARCDGQPIRWPEPTHGPGRPLPWRTAAECIDWSIPCPSIFDRKRPLAEKTLQRIARGIVRYVLEDPAPFVVQVQHGRDDFRGQPLDRPLTTLTERHGFGLVTPFLAPRYGERPGQEPRTMPVDTPMPTIVPTGNGGSLVAPTLLRSDMHQSHSRCTYDPADPLRTITTTGGHALVSAFLARHYGGPRPVTGQEMERPVSTITAWDHHSLVACHVSKFRSTSTGHGVDEPLHTITTAGGGAGGHFGLVAAFLLKYYGSAVGQQMDEPLHTATGHAHFGLVTVQIEGETYAIADIGMRMLDPRELARAQGFPDSYVLTGSKAQQVARLGNSVCPPVAQALVRAQFAAEMAEAGAA